MYGQIHATRSSDEYLSHRTKALPRIESKFQCEFAVY